MTKKDKEKCLSDPAVGGSPRRTKKKKKPKHDTEKLLSEREHHDPAVGGSARRAMPEETTAGVSESQHRKKTKPTMKPAAAGLKLFGNCVTNVDRSQRQSLNAAGIALSCLSKYT